MRLLCQPWSDWLLASVFFEYGLLFYKIWNFWKRIEIGDTLSIGIYSSFIAPFGLKYLAQARFDYSVLDVSLAERVPKPGLTHSALGMLSVDHLTIRPHLSIILDQVLKKSLIWNENIIFHSSVNVTMLRGGDWRLFSKALKSRFLSVALTWKYFWFN